MSDPAVLPAVAGQPVSVVLLVRNGAAHLQSNLDGWCTFLDGRQAAYELILVDVGSTDDTAVLAEKLTAGIAALQLFSLPADTGMGPALRLGLERAQYPLVLYTTADGQYAPADAAELFRWIDHVSLVCGYRARRRLRRQGAFREGLGRLGLRWLFGLRLKDPHCFYVLARRSSLRRAPVQSTGAFAHAEVLAKANFLGCLMTDAPVQWTPRPAQSAPVTWSAWRQSFADGRRLFGGPHFGPPFLFEDAPWACTWLRALSPFA